MSGLDLEVAGAASAFATVAAALGLQPAPGGFGVDMLSITALADLNVAATRDAASNAAAVADQTAAGATGIDNVATYVGTDTNNAASLSDSGASTVAV
ncbi:hypothetical protein [Mycolicibacterium lutetiense]